MWGEERRQRPTFNIQHPTFNKGMAVFTVNRGEKRIEGAVGFGILDRNIHPELPVYDYDYDYEQDMIFNPEH